MSAVDGLAAAPDQSGAAAALAQTFVLLDDSSGRGPSYLFTDPVAVVEASEPEDVGGAFAEIQRGLDQGLHAAGFLSYELGYVLEPKLAPLLPERRDIPFLWFGLYREPLALTSGEVDGWLARHLRSGAYQFDEVRLSWNEEQYLARFASVLERIKAGDIYQLNLTFKARFRLRGSPLTFYRDMRQRQRVQYGGIVDTGKATILSASPELFISKNGETIETRPMKGTAPRAGTPEADRETARMLAADAKQRAENLMIVDLMRNDLGRIAGLGGVSVTDLFTVETYRTLHQMTSGVRARLRPGLGMAELIGAIFPPGSVTGAPKIRAMELIRELESEPRGAYCGAIGFMSPSGEANFNVAIRSPVVHRGGFGEMGIGSGVVYDSVGVKEYAECLLKMKFLTDPPKPFHLIETMLHEPGRGFWLLDRHLERLRSSASYFDFPFDAEKVRAALDEAVTARRDERLRVRLLLADDGAITVTAADQPPQPEDGVMRFAVSKTRMSSDDPFLFHKTTRRELYDREHAEHAARGADEVVYLNEAGEVTEGSRTNVFVERDGLFVTPRLTAGLLPGTLRAELLASGRAVEGVVGLDEITGAAPVHLGNSVRGLVRARLLD